MHPETAIALTEARIADLHRDAAQQRLARTAAPRNTARRTIRDAWATALTGAAGWNAVRSRTARPTASADPGCCPA
jgi:hypothetical protein